MSAIEEFGRELDGLRQTVLQARAMPMSASAVINRQEVLDALERIEAGFTAATAEARSVADRRADVVAAGEAEAAEIVRLARLEQERLVSDTEVFRLGQRAAEDAKAASVAESEALRAETERYIEQRLADLEHALERTLGEVRRGIANLGGHNAFDEPDHLVDDVLLAGPDAG